ncbi:nucleic acid/nucleotide deaminase domain-containing protein [Streptomyces sp. NPDC016845]|uniref:nucleic acid/nucleotide deaminase domain-containing protein n=1 Tax=Streptomyces sp. NPDC016845 TaxID=3364972 RepID=UPI00378FD6CE
MPAAEGDAELVAWSADFDAATLAVRASDLDAPAATPEQLAQRAQALERRRAAARTDYSEQVRRQMPPVPKAGDKDTTLDTTDADHAVHAVEATGHVRLSDQTFPPPKPLPSPAPAEPASPTPVTVQPSALGPSPLLTGIPATGADADDVDARIAAVGPVSVGFIRPLPPTVVTSRDVAALEPLPPVDAAEVGDVVARILASSSEHVQEFLTAATSTLDPGRQVAALQPIAQQLRALEQENLDIELRGTAAAAGIAETTLNAKMLAAREQLLRQDEAISDQLSLRADIATGDVHRRSADQSARIGAARSAADEEAGLKQQAVTGGADPTGIEATRDRYLRRVTDRAAAAVARLRAAYEIRAGELRRLDDQRKAYDRARTGTESGAARDWAEQESLEIDAVVARLTREAGEETRKLTASAWVVATSSRDQVRDWAARQECRERGWWERLFDLVSDWLVQSRSTTEAWEAQRDAETRDTVAADLDMLREVHEQIAAGNRQAVVGEMARLNKEQRTVVVAYLASGGQDSIGAVATGVVARIRARRVPELTRRIEAQAIKDLAWEDLDALGRQQNPAFQAGHLTWDIRRAVKGSGTDEPLLFSAIGGRTPVQIAAVRKAYTAIFERDMDDDINSDVAGSEQDRADKLLSGDPIAGAVATIADAVAGPGTEEATITQALRTATPAQREAIVVAYEKTYGIGLLKELGSELRGNDLAQAQALLAGDIARADAIALDEAMSGPGTRLPAINAVYTQIRDEVEAKGADRHMTTAEIEAEIRRRTAAVQTAYGAHYGGGEAALGARFENDLEDGELGLVLAQQAVDRTAIDAAKLQIEHESILWADDDKINAVLRAQHERAEQEVERDLRLDFARRTAAMTPDQREAARRHLEQGLSVAVHAAAKKNMADLRAAYDAASFTGAFQFMLAWDLAGNSQAEAAERVETGGKPSDAKELQYAIYGAGTNEDTIRRVLQGKTKQELAAIVAEYHLNTKSHLAVDLAWDLSDRDEADMLLLLECGSGTPQEVMAYLRARRAWETEHGTGPLGDWTGEETRALIATVDTAQHAFDLYEALLVQPGATDDRVQAARARFERWAGYGTKAIEHRRAQQDAVTDAVINTVVTIGTVVTSAAAIVFTGGAAAPAVVVAAAGYFGTSTAVMSAVIGAVATTAASIALNRGMKGAAYGGEQAGTDLAQGLAEAVIAAAGAKFAGPALERLGKASAIQAMTRTARSGRLGEVAGAGLAEALGEAIEGLPSGVVSAILDDRTWAAENPLLVIMEAAGSSSLQSAGTGFVTGAGTKALASGIARLRSRRSGGATSTPPTADGTAGASTAEGPAQEGAKKKKKKVRKKVRMYILNDDGTVDRLMPDGTIPVKGAKGLDADDRIRLVSLLEPDGTVWRPQTRAEKRSVQRKGEPKGVVTSQKIDPDTSDLAHATQLARKAHNHYGGQNYAAGRYIDPQSGYESILTGRSSKIGHSERMIGRPLIHRGLQANLSEVFTERSPCQKNPRCNVWLGHFFLPHNPSLEVTHAATYDQSKPKTQNDEHLEFREALQEAHGKKRRKRR